MKKYEFDVCDEELAVPALNWVLHHVTINGGHILEYKKIGPGGGNAFFIVEVENANALGFEAWLKQCCDVNAARL